MDLFSKSNSHHQDPSIRPLHHTLSGSIRLKVRTEHNMPKLVPTNPEQVMAIRNVTPNIVTCSAPFWRGGIIKMGGRGTIGEYCLLSAIPALVAIVATFGKERCRVSCAKWMHCISQRIQLDCSSLYNMPLTDFKQFGCLRAALLSSRQQLLLQK